MRIIGGGTAHDKHLFGLEAQFEKEILRMKDEIFLGGHYERWDPTFKEELIDDGVKPDGLFLSYELDEWWIVEVELARDSKMDHIQDQLGRLERVDYSKYRDVLEKKLTEMNIENAKGNARNLCAERPNFLLILDDYNQKIIERAQTRGFATLVLETYKSPCGQTGILMSNELPITRERDTESESIYTLVASDLNRKKVNADVWWFELDKKHPFDKDTVEIVDKHGSFTVLVEEFGGKQHLRLPTDRTSVRDILKGNRIGNVFPTEHADRYELQTIWPPI
ncbi:MAG: hypothetical protein QF440_03105 [Candidatus Thalassarchaeaceae archaeon]|jgi:hypothetical protein|nr:hypothetical protein [Candidatus Thalassarchaeaceae archaeon]